MTDRRIAFTIALCALLSAPAVRGAELHLRAMAASDYVHRGVAQTDDGIAYQALAEVETDSGLYAGTWMSRVDYAFDDREFEIDWFAGYVRRFDDVAAIDVGIIRYTFDERPSNRSYDWTELQFAVHFLDRLSVLMAAGDGWLGRNEPSYVLETTYRHPLPWNTVLDTTWGMQFAHDVIGQNYHYGEMGLARAFGALNARVFVTGTQGIDLPAQLGDTRVVLSLAWNILD